MISDLEPLQKCEGFLFDNLLDLTGFKNLLGLYNYIYFKNKNAAIQKFLFFLRKKP